MSIWDHIKKSGEPLVEPVVKEEPKAKTGDVIEGIIINMNKKGFGFISSKSIPFERIFFHWSGLRRDTHRFLDLLNLYYEKKEKEESIKVEFEAQETKPNDWRAIKIKVIE